MSSTNVIDNLSVPKAHFSASFSSRSSWQMRILISVDPEIPIPPKLYGGIERIVNSLVSELRSRGHTVGLLANRQSTAQTDRLFPWPAEHSSGTRNSLANLSAMRHAVRNFAPDVIHSFSRLLYLLGVLDTSIPRIMSFQREPTRRTVRYSSTVGGRRLIFTGCSEYICRQGRPGGGVWFPIPNF